MIFLIISIIIFMAVATFVPKRLTKPEIYAIALFSIILGFITDIPLDLKYKLYGYFKPGVQFAGFLPILFLFPTSGVIYMNFFPFHKSLVHKTFYTFCWTIFCLVFEYLSIKSGYFYHNAWKYWHSALAYPILFWFHILHLKLFKKHISNT